MQQVAPGPDAAPSLHLCRHNKSNYQLHTYVN